jgi:hypothetical protein
VTASVLALRDAGISQEPPVPPAPRWEPAYVAALQRIGLDLQPPDPRTRRTEDAITGAGSR